MYFPWSKYREVPLERRNTLQVFITNRCNLRCTGCFARHIMKGSDKDMSMSEYESVVSRAAKLFDVKQINLLGGESFIHKDIQLFIDINKHLGLKSTIYSNGYFMENEIEDAKIRISIYNFNSVKGATHICKSTKNQFDANFMVSASTTVEEMLQCAKYLKDTFADRCKVFFISSLRELDNPRKEFFDDTSLTMPVLQYKELVHKFLTEQTYFDEVHVSKRGVFESTCTLSDNTCHFSNYFIGGKIIQCPYNVVNKVFQNDFTYGNFCVQNNTCLMSKVKYIRR